MPYQHQTQPFIVPTTDGKLIEEHFGLASLTSNNLSIAHMIAPPGWGEPFQTPEFDEYTLISRGKKQIEADGEIIIVSAGQSILIKKVQEYATQTLLKKNVNIGVCAYPPFLWKE